MFLISIALIVCSILNAQDKYVYNNFGKLQYIVRDTISFSDQVLGDIFIEQSKTVVGSYVAYRTSKHFLIQDAQFKHISTTHTPIVFGVEISKKSLDSFIVWLRHVMENCGVMSKGKLDKDNLVPTDYPSYTFTDETLQLMVTIRNSNGEWFLMHEKDYWRTDILNRIFPALEELLVILEEKHNEYNI
jgi:hypothetical protein